jgi:hypothetical protein
MWSWRAMSARTSGVAVAVNAAIRGGASSARAEPAVVRPEVVAPLADAVRLVDRDQRDPRRRDPQRVDEPRAAEPLRRDVDQRVHPGADAVDDVALLLGPGGRGQRRRGDAAGAQRVDLVLHQRDQRRHHERDAALIAEHHRRELVAQRLAGAGRHHRDHRVAGEHVGDHVGLARAQPVVPEPLERARERVRNGCIDDGRGEHRRHPTRSPRQLHRLVLTRDHRPRRLTCPDFGREQIDRRIDDCVAAGCRIRHPRRARRTSHRAVLLGWRSCHGHGSGRRRRPVS